MRSRAYRLETIRYWIRLHVLGRWYSAFLRCRTCSREYRRRSCLEAPIRLSVGLANSAYFAPDSPWNAVRRGKNDEARKSLGRLAGQSDNKAQEVESTLAYIIYTTEQERAETEGATILDCFRGTNLRRTEIVSRDPPKAPVLLTHICRTASSGLLRFCVVTPSSDTVSSS